VVLLNEGFQRQLIELARDHDLLGATPDLARAFVSMTMCGVQDPQPLL
tara:strand:+ start:155 stop:298 length:144 start_codon:yes stop_codon:yes gene_type:complete